MQEHERCPVDSHKSWRPTRLIDLGCEGQETVRLDISSTPAKYITLSHRWGNTDIFKATKSMIAKLQVGIEIEKLPRKFIEAFTVCRKLGYRYIWIDSLCILQDDDDDWRAEASLMGNNYANAELNISATGSKDSDSGLFVQREANLVTPIKVMISEPGSPFNPGSYYILDPQVWSAGVSEAPLNSRGWVFQERLLARRVLHFGQDQLFFECQQKDVCEIFPLGLPTTPTYSCRDLGAAPIGHFKGLDPMIDGRRARKERARGRQCVDESLNPYFLWAELVETYSRLQLTKATDKLIAVSGLVKLLQTVLSDDQYLAGLWRRHLPYHLLWSKRKHLRHGTNSLDYCAPSWSWASIKDQVDMYPVSTSSDNEVILVDIVEAEVIPVGEDETGQLVGGYIKLRGPLQPAHWAFYRPSEDDVRTTNLVPKLTLQGSTSPANISVSEDESDRLYSISSHNTSVFCLPVHVWWQDGDICTNGLILESIEWASSSLGFPSLFRRVGKFKIHRADVDGHTQFYGFDRALMVNRDSREQTPKWTRTVIEAYLSWHEITIV